MFQHAQQNIRCQKFRKDLNRPAVGTEESRQTPPTQIIPELQRNSLELENNTSREFRAVLVGVEVSRSHNISRKPIGPTPPSGVDVHAAAELVCQRSGIAIRRSRQIMRSAHKGMRPKF